MYHAYLIHPSADGGLSPLDTKQLCDALVEAGAGWTGRPNEYAWNYAGLGPARIKVRRQVVDLLVQVDPPETLAQRVAISLRFALDVAEKFGLVLFDPQVGKIVDPRDVEAIEQHLEPEMVREGAYATLEEEVFALALPDPSVLARATAGLRNGLDLLMKAATAIPLLGWVLAFAIWVVFFPVYAVSWLFDASRQQRLLGVLAGIAYLFLLVGVPLAVHYVPELPTPFGPEKTWVYSKIGQYYAIVNVACLAVTLLARKRSPNGSTRGLRLMRAMTTPL